MVNIRRKKPGSNHIVFWIIIFILLGALITGYRLWSCLFNTTPQFNFILISKDDTHLKYLNGEKVVFHPENRLKILDISTNICFNHGIRLFAKGLDINAILNQEIPLKTLLPEKDILNRYAFRIEIKHFNQDIGHVDMVVEPFVEDWLDKANRSITPEIKISVLEKALEIYPADKRIKTLLIKEYKTANKLEKAAVMLENVAKEDPDTALYDLLAVYEEMSKNDKVLSVLKRMIELNPEDMEIRLRLAEGLEEAGKYKEALMEYETLLSITPKGDRLKLYKSLGFLYAKTGELNKAIAAYSKAAEIDQNDVNLYYNLSLLYDKAGQKNNADIFLSKAVKLRPEDADAKLKLSENLLKKGDLKEAEMHIKDVLKSHPKSIIAWQLMALIAEKRNDKKSLINAYEKILSAEPENKTIIYNLGIVQYETGNLEKALTYLEKYIKDYPEDVNTRSILFDIYRKQKKETQAFKEASKIINLRPKEAGYYHYLFEYLNKKGDYKEMTGIMENGLKNNPGNNDIRKYLILAYLNTGKDDLATARIIDFLKVYPNDITMLLHLAALEEKSGKVKEAMAAYKKVIDLSPGHQKAEEAYLRLRLENLQHK